MAAQRFGGAVDNIAEQVILRVDQSVSHLEPRLGDPLRHLGRACNFGGQCLLDGDHELFDGVDGGPLARLERLEQLVRQLRGPIDDALKASRRNANQVNLRGLSDRLGLAGYGGHSPSVPNVCSSMIKYTGQRLRVTP